MEKISFQLVTNGALFFVRHGLNFFQHKEDSWRPPPPVSLMLSFDTSVYNQ